MVASCEGFSDTGSGDSPLVGCHAAWYPTYMSSGPLDYEPAKPGFVSPHVRLLGFRAVNRVCGSCVSDVDNLPAGWPALGVDGR